MKPRKSLLLQIILETARSRNLDRVGVTVVVVQRMKEHLNPLFVVALLKPLIIRRWPLIDPNVSNSFNRVFQKSFLALLL